MKRTVAIAFAAALLCHALLLFGFRASGPARPLSLSETPQTMDVALVAAPPESPETPPPAQEPTATATPEPPPSATPLPQPEPEPTTPEPLPSPTPKPAASPEQAMPRPAHPAPSASQSARPRHRDNPPPKYPEAARRNGEQGVVLIRVLVDAEGRPGQVSLKQSSGFPLLDAAALEAVRQWTFEPARAGGLPVASRVDLPVRFALRPAGNQGSP